MINNGDGVTKGRLRPCSLHNLSKPRDLRPERLKMEAAMLKGGRRNRLVGKFLTRCLKPLGVHPCVGFLAKHDAPRLLLFYLNILVSFPGASDCYVYFVYQYQVRSYGKLIQKLVALRMKNLFRSFSLMQTSSVVLV